MATEQDVHRTDAIAETPAWLTMKEAAKHTRCSKKVLYRAAAAGKLRAAKVNGHGAYRFRVAWLDSWLESTAAPVEILR